MISTLNLHRLPQSLALIRTGDRGIPVSSRRPAIHGHRGYKRETDTADELWATAGKLYGIGVDHLANEGWTNAYLSFSAAKTNYIEADGNYDMAAGEYDDAEEDYSDAYDGRPSNLSTPAPRRTNVCR